jgi:WD40 repeat protein
VVYSPNGRWLASGGDDRRVRLWGMDGKIPVHTLDGHTGPVRCVTFSPDGRSLASAGEDGTVRTWEVATGEPMRVLDARGSTVRGVAISPNGRWLATAGTGAAVRLWDAGDGALLATLLPLEDDGWACFLPDGGYKLQGPPAGEFWYVAGLCRFEAGELDGHVPGLGPVDPMTPILGERG